MKINEILLEDARLDEGPIGNIGTAVGRGVGGLAKGVGAVAGGIAGIGRAVKKGYQTGRATVAGDPDPNAPADQAAPAAGGQAAVPAAQGSGQAAPAAQGGSQAAPAARVEPKLDPEPAANATPGIQTLDPAKGQSTAAPTAQDINAQGPAGTAPAKPQTGAGAAALAKTDQATQNATADKAGQTVYAQVKSQINNLDKKGKQRILQLLQKSLQGAPAKGAAPAGGAAAPAAPAAQPAAAPETPAAQPAADATQQAPAQEPAAKPKRTRNKKSAATPAAQPTQAEIDADRERIMGPTSDSIIRTGNNLAETLMKAIAEEKRRMVSEGKISIFRQYH